MIHIFDFDNKNICVSSYNKLSTLMQIKGMTTNVT